MLRDLYVMASFCDNTWAMTGQGTRDAELLEVVEACQRETAAQMERLPKRR